MIAHTVFVRSVAADVAHCLIAGHEFRLPIAILRVLLGPVPILGGMRFNIQVAAPVFPGET